MSLTDTLFKSQATRLAQAIAAALDDPRLETSVDTTRFSGACRDAAIQANRMLDLLRSQTAATESLLDAMLDGRGLPAASHPPCARSAVLAQRLHAQSRRDAALNQVGMPVMIADEQGTIVTINQSMANLLYEVGYDLEPALRGIEASTVIGCQIDLFYADPFRHVGVDAGSCQPRATQLTLADRHFELRVSDLQDEQGAFCGSIVEWHEQMPTRALRIDRASQAMRLN